MRTESLSFVTSELNVGFKEALCWNLGVYWALIESSFTCAIFDKSFERQCFIVSFPLLCV